MSDGELADEVKGEFGSIPLRRHVSSAFTTLGVLLFGIMMGAHLVAWRVRTSVDPFASGYGAVGDFYGDVMLWGGIAAILAIAVGFTLTMRGDRDE